MSFLANDADTIADDGVEGRARKEIFRVEYVYPGAKRGTHLRSQFSLNAEAVVGDVNFDLVGVCTDLNGQWIRHIVEHGEIQRATKQAKKSKHLIGKRESYPVYIEYAFGKWWRVGLRLVGERVVVEVKRPSGGLRVGCARREDWGRAADDATNVDRGLESGLDAFWRCVGIGVERGVEAGMIGVRDRALDDGVDVAEIGGEGGGVEQEEATCSDTSGCRRGKHGCACWVEICSSPSKVNSDRNLERWGAWEDNSFERGENGITERGDNGLNGFKRLNGDGVRFLLVAEEADHQGLERDLYTWRMSSQGRPERERRRRRERLTRQYNAVSAIPRLQSQGTRGRSLFRTVVR